MTNKYTIEELKEKLSTLNTFSAGVSHHPFRCCAKCISVEDIEKLFNIKLK